MGEREITEPVHLCDSNGRLRPESIGWARSPLIRCDLSHHFMRKKRWNYWCISNQDFLLSATISDLDYAGVVFLYYLDLRTMAFLEKTVVTPLGKGCRMSDEVNETVEFSSKDLTIAFLNNNGTVDMHINCEDFGGKNMSASLTIELPPGHETLNVVIPWSQERFQFTSKQNCLPASGTFMVGEQIYEFEQEHSFACLDFGRGVWPRYITWNWASLSCRQDEHTLGLNLGAKWTDGTGMTENALLIDGNIEKLGENIIFSYEENNLMKPWKLTSEVTDRIKLDFIPLYERVAKSNFGLISSDVHQMIGRFTGQIKSEKGLTFWISPSLGWAEYHNAKW